MALLPSKTFDINLEKVAGAPDSPKTKRKELYTPSGVIMLHFLDASSVSFML